MNYLFCSVGRRGELLKDFRKTLPADSVLVATDNSKYQKLILQKISSTDVLINVCTQNPMTDWIYPILAKVSCKKILYKELRKKNKCQSFIRRCISFIYNPKGHIVGRKNAIEINKKMLPFREQLEKRNLKFKEFQDKYYSLSEKRYENYSDIKFDCPNYDAYICGSDQIWNPNFCDMDDNYYLSFAPNGKKIAYAPSFGVATLPHHFFRDCRRRIEKIDVISVRETSGVKIVKNLIGKEVPVVLDPTFLVNRAHWSDIANNSELCITESYVSSMLLGKQGWISYAVGDEKQ